MRKSISKKKTEVSIRDRIADNYPDTELLFISEPEYDKAIIGVVDSSGMGSKVVYDIEKVIKISMGMGMTHEEAVEYFEYNQIGAYMGGHSPAFVRTIKNLDY